MKNWVQNSKQKILIQSVGSLWTISGACLNRATQFTYRGIRFTIFEADERRIHRIHIQMPDIDVSAAS